MHFPFRVRAALLFAIPLVLALQLVTDARAQAPAADKEQCLAAHERAQVDRLQGRLLDARAGLLVCAQRGCPRLVSKDCTVWLGEVDASLPTVVFSAVDESGAELSDVRVSFGDRTLTNHLDKQPLMLDPGPYALRFEAPGHEPLSQQVTIHEGEKGRVLRVTLRSADSAPVASAALEPVSAEPSASAPAATPIRAKRLLVASSVLLAAGGATLVAALATGLVGYNKKRDCQDDDGCDQSTRDRGARLYRTVNYSLGAGGAVFLAGAALLWPALQKRAESKRSDAGPTAASVRPYADAHAAGLSFHSSW